MNTKLSFGINDLLLWDDFIAVVNCLGFTPVPRSGPISSSIQLAVSVVTFYRYEQLCAYRALHSPGWRQSTISVRSANLTSGEFV